MKRTTCIETEIGVGTVGVWSDFQAAMEFLDPFQELGIPCWQSFAGPLDSLDRESNAENE